MPLSRILALACLLAFAALSAAQGAQVAANAQCSTWDDVEIPFEVANLALNKLEQITASNDVYSSVEASLTNQHAPPGAPTITNRLTIVTHATTTLYGCVHALLAGNVEYRDVEVIRSDSSCPRGLLQDPSLTTRHNLTIASDPCCIPSLRDKECCAPRTYSITAKNILHRVRLAPLDPSGLVCRRAELIERLVPHIQEYQKREYNGMCGRQVIPQSSFQQWISTAQRCLDHSFHRVPCSSSDQCVTGVCLEGTCTSNRSPAHLLQCVVEALNDVRLESQLRLVLGLPVSAPHGDLIKAFTHNVTDEGCETATGLRLPYTQQQCVSLSSVDCEAPTQGDVTCDRTYVCSTTEDDSVLVSAADCQQAGFCLNPGVQVAHCTKEPACSMRCGTGMCTTEKECALQGFCEDALYISEAGNCVFPFSNEDESGADVCSDASTVYSPIGCIKHDTPSLLANRLTPLNCSQIGGAWVIRAQSSTECADPQRCSHASKQRSWRWVSARWDTSRVVSTRWRAASEAPSLRWSSSAIDSAKVMSVFRQVYNGMVAQPFASYLRCKSTGLQRILRAVMCECSDVPGRPEKPSECWDDSPVITASIPIVKGTSGSLAVLHSTLSWFAASCDNDVSACNLKAGQVLYPPKSLLVAPANSVRRKVSKVISVLSSAGDIVYSEKGQPMGQTVSEPIYLELSAELKNGVALCLTINNHTTVNGTALLGIPSIARVRESDSRYVTERASQYDATLSTTGQICQTVSSTGTYAAALIHASSAATLSAGALLLVALLVIF